MAKISLGLLGKDIAHSKSKNMYEELLGCDVSYTHFDHSTPESIPTLEEIFSKVSGLSITIDVAGQGQPLGVTRGAVTRTQHTPSGVTYENLTLEFVTMAENDTLLNWYLESNPKAYMGGATEARDRRSSASLVFYRQNGDEGARYNIRNCLPVKYTSTQLSAESTDLFKETIEIMHAGIIRDMETSY